MGAKLTKTTPVMRSLDGKNLLTLDDVAKFIAKQAKGGDDNIAFTNPRERKMLKDAGGSGKPHPLMPSVQMFDDGGGDGGGGPGGDSDNGGGNSSGGGERGGDSPGGDGGPGEGGQTEGGGSGERGSEGPGGDSGPGVSDSDTDVGDSNTESGYGESGPGEETSIGDDISNAIDSITAQDVGKTIGGVLGGMLAGPIGSAIGGYVGGQIAGPETGGGGRGQSSSSSSSSASSGPSTSGNNNDNSGGGGNSGGAFDNTGLDVNGNSTEPAAQATPTVNPIQALYQAAVATRDSQHAQAVNSFSFFNHGQPGTFNPPVPFGGNNLPTLNSLISQTQTGQKAGTNVVANGLGSLFGGS